jgi:Zn-dependent peptidase ImmA (M78 family)/DNA-binding XRE family transcriptional regulator
MRNPDRVELVRRRLGLTKLALAEKLGVDRKTVQRFESGQSELPEACIERLCSLSGYPEKFFEKQAVEFPSAAGVSFRSLRSLTSSTRDAALAAGALAFEVDDWITERYGLPDHRLVQIENRSPEEAAAFLRARWGIGERPIGNMINLLEAHGVRVFSLAEETRHLDAYSFWRNDKPYVFLNTLKTAERSRQDAAHELGHLVMHRHTGSSHPNAENEANAFAGAFLMPPADVIAEVSRVRSINDIISAKRRWGVSAAALNFTLHKLGKISDWNYRGYYIALGKMGRDFEPNGMDRETSQIWTKILTDLWNRGISPSRLAEELGIPEFELSSLLFGITSPVSPDAPKPAVGPLRLVP